MKYFAGTWKKFSIYLQLISGIFCILAEINFRYIEFMDRKKSKFEIVDDYKRDIAETLKKAVPNSSSVSVNINNKPRIPLPPNVMVFQTFAYLAATELKPSSNKVLMLFFANSGYENYVGMDVKTIAEILEVSERTVTTATNELEKHNIILKTQHPSDRRRYDYFLNPFASWKGNSESRKKMMQVIPDNQLELFGTNAKDSVSREQSEIKRGKPTFLVE